MLSKQPHTTIRFTDEDRKVIDKLQRLTGLTSATAIVRMAIRESLAARQAKAGKR